MSRRPEGWSAAHDEALAQRIQVMRDFLPEVAELQRQMQSGDRGALQIDTKLNQLDLVTAADIESERRIVAAIRAAFGDDAILAEESASKGEFAVDGFTWVIDPVDGTVNYAHGMPLYSISVGIAYKGYYVGGLIEHPALHDRYEAQLGRGATLNGRPISVTDLASTATMLATTGFPYTRGALVGYLTAGVADVLRGCQDIRRTGSAALDLSWLAAGRTDYYYEIFLNPWDVAAGVALVEQAGGVVTDIDGNPFHGRMKSLVASNGKAHDEVLRIVRPAVIAALECGL